jgi:hypothetical protein
MIINIDGNGWDSSLAIKEKRKWISVHNGAQFLRVLGDKYTFLYRKNRTRNGRQYSFYFQSADTGNLCIFALLCLRIFTCIKGEKGEI